MILLTQDELTYSQEDQDYINARNKLIPRAVKFVNSIYDKDLNREAWDLAFIKKMDELARQAGLVTGGL